MISFLKVKDDKVWDIVEECYIRPTVVMDGQTILKPKAQWTQEEKPTSNHDNKEINAIYNAVTQSKFHMISTSSSAKAARMSCKPFMKSQIQLDKLSSKI